MSKKTPQPLIVDSLRRLEKRANIPTEELIVTMLYSFDINNNSMISGVD